jgi:hypothetical protein
VKRVTADREFGRNGMKDGSPRGKTGHSGGKASKVVKPKSAAVWKTAAGQATGKPARGMNPEAGP